MIGMEWFYKHLFDVGNVVQFFSAEISIETDIEYSASPRHIKLYLAHKLFLARFWCCL